MMPQEMRSTRQLRKEKNGDESAERLPVQQAGPEAEITQLRSLQSAINGSPQVSQLRSLQSSLGNALPVQRLAQVNQGLTAGPSANQAGTQGALPDQLKAGVESLSGMDMSDVKVHYGSGKPAQLGAHAFAQGNDIHVAPGQEQHLAHEAWHVVQQRQGRVQATTDAAGVPMNDSASLEQEADAMGAKAAATREGAAAPTQLQKVSSTGAAPVQAKLVDGNGKPLSEREIQDLYLLLDEKVVDFYVNAEQEYTARRLMRRVIFSEYRPPVKKWTWKMPEGFENSLTNDTMYESSKKFGLKMSTKRKGMSSDFTDEIESQNELSNISFEGSEKLKNGKGLKKNGLSRNHHLADSSVRGIIEYLYKNKGWKEELSAYKKIEKWMKALTHGEGIYEKAMKMLMNASNLSDLDEIVDLLSNNAWNVGIGDAEINGKIGPNFDESRTQGGFVSVQSAIISMFTEFLRGVVPNELVDSALNTLRDKESGETLTSMSIDLKLEEEEELKQGVYDAEDLSDQQIIGIIDQLLIQKNRIVTNIVEELKGDRKAIVKLVRERNMRFRIGSMGQVMIALRGG